MTYQEFLASDLTFDEWVAGRVAEEMARLRPIFLEQLVARAADVFE